MKKEGDEKKNIQKYLVREAMLCHSHPKSPNITQSQNKNNPPKFMPAKKEKNIHT